MFGLVEPAPRITFAIAVARVSLASTAGLPPKWIAAARPRAPPTWLRPRRFSRALAAAGPRPRGRRRCAPFAANR
eukprot:3582483-Pyramimonas_sp.AAC.1